MKKLKHYSNVLGKQPHKVRFLLSRILRFTNLCRLLRIRRPGYNLRFYPSNLSTQLWINPKARMEDENFLDQYLMDGDLVIDIGANIGMLTLKSADMVGNKGRVYAFEPNPRVCNYLRGNIRLNKFRNIEVYQNALSDVAGIQTIEDAKGDDMCRVGTGLLSITTRRLDDFDFGERTIALLKIDVEGFEKFVLQGAIKTLEKTEAIYFECSEDNFSRYNYTASELFDLLHASRFSIFRLENGVLEQVNEYRNRWRVENFIAVRDAELLKTRIGL